MAIYTLLIFAPLARGAVQPWAITVIHLLTLVALAAFLLACCHQGRFQWIATPVDRPLAAVVALVLVSAGFSLCPPASRRAVMLLIDYVVVFYLAIHLFNTRERMRRLVEVIVAVAFFLAVFGLVKRFGANPFPWWDYGELRYQPEFLAATYGNHNHLAGFMEMAIPLTLSLLFTGLGLGWRMGIAYLALLQLVALALSLSRGGWVGALVGLTFFAGALMASRYFKAKKALGTAMGTFVLLALVVLASSPVVARIQTVVEADEAASLASRLIAWQGTARVIADHPLVGTGPGTFRTIFPQYQPPGLSARFTKAHNDYLDFTSETGLLLVPLCLWMAVALFARGVRKLKNPSRLARGITLGALTGIVAILIHSISDFNLQIPANALVFTVLAAMVAAPLRHLTR